MIRNGVLLFAIGALSLAVGHGCANPADDKPEAVVADPADETAVPAEGERYALTGESTIGWVGSKVTGSHDGGFHEFEGEILLVDGDPEKSSVRVTIETASLWADRERLTGHLKSADFFDVEKFPAAVFQSTSIERSEDGYDVTGNLELHGVTKSISFPADISVLDGRITVEAEFFIRRFDFGIVYPGKPDDLIRDEVVIKLNVAAVPASDEAREAAQ